MTTNARRRLVKDWKRMQDSCTQGFNAAPLEDNILLWEAVIFGPEQSIWEGGIFKLLLEFSEDYPGKAPNVLFKTKMFHPNIYNDGKICIDILQSNWSPVYDVWAILTSIRSLLTDPNTSSPANNEAARLFEQDQKLYTQKVYDIVEGSWVDAQ